jgi:carbon monoxide dehydrogenase subunit G
MARFVGEYSETFLVRAPLETVRAHFGNLDRIVDAYPDVEQLQRPDDQTLHFVLKNKAAQGISFQARYGTRYQLSRPDRIDWGPAGIDANMWSSGHSTFVAVGPDQTRVTYQERVEVEMSLNFILAKLAGPLVASELRKGVSAYLTRLCAPFGARQTL